MRVFPVTLTIVTVTLLGSIGCAATGEKLRELPPSSERATLYVYRLSTFVGIADWDVPTLFVNDVEVTKLRIGGGAALLLKPGVYNLELKKSRWGTGSQRMIVGKLDLQVEAQQVIYARFELAIDSIHHVPGSGVVATPSFNFVIINPMKGRAEIITTNQLPLINEDVPPRTGN